MSLPPDSVAYIGLAERHMSVMVAVDAATEENGCLFVSPGVWGKGQVPLTNAGTLDPEYEENINFIPLPCVPGDVIIFSGNFIAIKW